jgi:hypothetical protein
MPNKSHCVYLIGSMEFRTYEELKFEHYYVRTRLSEIGIAKVIDPLIKEKHKPGKKVTLTKCGIKPSTVYEVDMKAVEEADILLWMTGDIISEGSVTEIAVGGAWNRWAKKPLKTIVIVSPKRFHGKLIHFSNFHKNVTIVESVDDAIALIKKRFHL